MKNIWVNASKRLPSKDGLYLVYAPSADTKSPLIIQCWWSKSKGFYSLVPIWKKEITHWMKVYPPKP